MPCQSSYTPDYSLSSMMQRDSSTALADAITSSHCYENYTDCLLLSVSSSNSLFWHIAVSMVLAQITCLVTSRAYSISVQDKDYAWRLLQLWLFLLHDTPHRAFPVTGARLWNSLPDNIITATSLVTFRHKLKAFLFRRSYDNVDTWLLDNLLFVLSFYFFFNFLMCFNPMYGNVVL